MEIKQSIKYLPSHEWAEINGATAKVGISDFAQNELGDLVYVELPAVGDTVTADKEFANVESVKAVSPVYSPVSGKVVAVNEDLDSAPELINEKAYDAWFIEVEVTAVSDRLMDAAAYAEIAK